MLLQVASLKLSDLVNKYGIGPVHRYKTVTSAALGPEVGICDFPYKVLKVCKRWAKGEQTGPKSGLLPRKSVQIV